MATWTIRDQENLAQGWETAAAGAKTVIKGGRTLAPKTPGKNAITPAAPRTARAPLGAKTSNIKATAFNTPAPLTGGAGLQKTQRRSASGRKPKLKIHQPEAVEAQPQLQDDDDDEPEIEYCPPKITELPDEPDDVLFPENYDYTWAREAMRNGCGFSDLHDDIGEDGLTKHQRQRKQDAEYSEASLDADLYEAVASSMPSKDHNPDFEEARKKATDLKHELDQKYFNGRYAARANTDPKKQKPPKPATSTMSAQSAAAALSSKPQPRFAAPTAAARAKQSYALEKDAPIKRNPPHPANMVASRSTIGYSKGRQVSSTLRGKQSAAPTAKKSTSQQKAVQPTLDQEKHNQLLESLTILEDDEDDDDSNPIPWQEDEAQFDNWFEQQMGGFRLSLPKELDDEGAAD